MKKILITRRLLKACEEKASKIFEANLNDNDELYSQSKVIEMSKGCDGILVMINVKNVFCMRLVGQKGLILQKIFSK